MYWFEVLFCPTAIPSILSNLIAAWSISLFFILSQLMTCACLRNCLQTVLFQLYWIATWIFPSVLYKKSRFDDKVWLTWTSSFLPNCNTFFQYDKENRTKKERKEATRHAINNNDQQKRAFLQLFLYGKTHTHLSLICINKLNEPC